jgi:hypothetical protein
MSGRTYTVSGGGITVANAAVTLAFVNPSSTVGIRIKRCWVSQTGVTTNAQQRVQLVSQVTAFPTLTSATPAAHSIGGPVSGITGGTAGAAGTAGINASAEGAGTKTVIIPDTFAIIGSGYLWVPTLEEVIEFPAGAASGFGLYLPVAAGTLTGWSFGVTYQEL